MSPKTFVSGQKFCGERSPRDESPTHGPFLSSSLQWCSWGPEVNRWTGEPGRSESNGVRLKAKQQCGSTEKSPKRKCSFQKSQKRYCILHVSSFIHTLDISGCLTLSCCTLGSVSGSHLISSQSLPPSQQLNAKTRLARRAKKNTAYRETL